MINKIIIRSTENATLLYIKATRTFVQVLNAETIMPFERTSTRDNEMKLFWQPMAVMRRWKLSM